MFPVCDYGLVPASTQVVVYVKPDCGLCGPLWDIVEKVRSEVDLDAEKIDISKDPELVRLYGLEVPVVLINGKKAFKGRMTEKAFRKKIESLVKHLPSVEALEAIEGEPFVPPPAVTALLLAVAILGAGYFFAEAVASAGVGRGRLAAQLFRVDAPKIERAIEFRLESYDGKKVGLDDFRGKVVLVNFWATWCPPCVEEMPSMRRFYDKMKSDPRFVFLAISADDGWDPVRSFFEREPPPFPVLLDPSGALAKKYGTEKFPETYVIIDGRIVGFIWGPRDWDRWYAEAYVESVLDHGRDLEVGKLAQR
jgi:peroxiredoxin